MEVKWNEKTLKLNISKQLSMQIEQYNSMQRFVLFLDEIHLCHQFFHLSNVGRFSQNYNKLNKRKHFI